MYGKEPLTVRSGGTVPATGIFKQVLGIDTISYAWSLPGSGAHAPNEWYRIDDFNRGREGYAKLIEHLKR
jgi:acetylornithine deacetylase/succinyl-diaminopimelate desuccinylase-like protein